MHTVDFAHIPLFSSLSIEEQAQYQTRNYFQVTRYPKNAVLHLEGERCTHLEILLSGTVAIDRIGEDGALMTIFELRQQDILGGNLLFTSHPFYPMTASCKTEVTLLSIGKEPLFEILSGHPQVLRSYLSFSNSQASSLSHTVKDYIGQPLREKLLRYFAAERNRQQRNPFLLPMSKKSLAERMGVQRTSVSRELRKMSQEGLLSVEKDKITLL